MPPQGTAVAEKVDVLYKFLVAISAVSCVLVIGGMVVFAVKYRRKPGVKSALYYAQHDPRILWSLLFRFGIFMLAFGLGLVCVSLLACGSPITAFEVKRFALKSGIGPFNIERQRIDRRSVCSSTYSR